MDGVQIAALVAVAVIVFWMLGAYNRLMALRNDIGAAYAQVDDGLARRIEVAGALAALLREPLANEQGALEALAQSLLQLQQCREPMKLSPASAAAAQALVSAASDFSATGSRVRALAEQQGALLAEPSSGVAAQLAAWREADARINFARQLFNDAVSAYNDALGQFPTRLLARLYGQSPGAHL